MCQTVGFGGNQTGKIIGSGTIGNSSISINNVWLDDGWILAMQDELNQFKRNDVWDLVPKPEHKNIIGTKWVFRNKLNEQGEVIRNKPDLLLKGTANKKELIMLNLLLQLQDWKLSGYFFLMQ